MIIKRYVADNMSEAMQKIRYDLGSNAIIVSQRKIRRKGLIGFFCKKIVEVTAAIESDKKYEEIKVEPVTNTPIINNQIKSKDEINSNGEILREIKKINEKINNLNNNKEEIENTKIKIKTKTESILENSDVIDKVIKKVVSRVNNNKLQISEMEKSKIVIEKMIPKGKEEGESRIVLVGPTGVGKTTTIAKLAGRFSIQEKKKVGLITIDTYRIGAVDQLRTYAEIIKIPFQVVYNVNDMDKALEKLKDCEIILVDTTGRNCKNMMQLSELRSYIEKVGTDNINLVLSATTKNKDLEAIINGYKVLNYKQIIITKLDETTTYGSLLNAIEASKKPISYVTTGQTVPDDILKLSPREIANLVLGVDKL